MASSWESSKENIKPLKAGRSQNVMQHSTGSMLKMPASFGNHSSSAASYQEMLKQKMDVESQMRWFEEKIRLQDSDDPLEYWYRYVKWIEQTFPTDREKEIKTLTSKCVKLLLDMKQYANDYRWWYIWFKVGTSSRSIGSLAIYQAMYESGHCTKLAVFYKQWGYELEQAEDFKEAKRIYLLGVEANAQPISELQMALENLEVHCGKRLAAILDENQDQFDTRNLLGVLKGVGKHNAAPSMRQSTVEKVKLGINVNDPQKPKNSAGFTIFTENSEIHKPKVMPSKSDDIFRLNVASCHNSHVKENMKNPAAWTNQKIKALGRVQINPSKAPSNAFVIYSEGEELKESISKPPIAFASGILKPVRPDIQSEESALGLMVRQKSENMGENKLAKVPPTKKLKEVLAFDHVAVSGGLTEMSFEEIHALAWMAQKTAKQTLNPSVNQLPPCTGQSDVPLPECTRSLNGNSSFTTKLNFDVMSLYNRSLPWLRQPQKFGQDDDVEDVERAPLTDFDAIAPFKIYEDDAVTGYSDLPAKFKNGEDKENIAPPDCVISGLKRVACGILTLSSDFDEDAEEKRISKDDIDRMRKFDESDYTVAGCMKPSVGERAASTPCRTMGAAFRPSFSLLEGGMDDNSGFDCVNDAVELPLGTMPKEPEIPQTCDNMAAAACTKLVPEKMAPEPYDASKIDNKLSTIVEETSVDYRSYSSSSGSSGGSTHGASLGGSAARRRFPSSFHLHTMTTIAEQQPNFASENSGIEDKSKHHSLAQNEIFAGRSAQAILQ